MQRIKIVDLTGFARANGRNTIGRTGEVSDFRRCCGALGGNPLRIGIVGGQPLVTLRQSLGFGVDRLHVVWIAFA